MRCRACGHENREGAAFCLECGQRLALVCDACGRELPAGARFCDGCGARIAARSAAKALDTGTPPSGPNSPAPHTYAPPPDLAAKILRERGSIEGERRTVTVLFIDAVGSMSTGERVGDEMLHRLVHECTDRMIDAVNRFEGTVTQFRGDGIMAIFGAPIAHEDSARRAIAAALAMRDVLSEYEERLQAEGKPSFAYRIGLNTGPVIVGTIGTDFSMDYTAIGDTVNLAARMEQWARPNSIYITRNTQRLVAGYFELRDLGLLEIKGKAEGVYAYEVLRELPQRSRLDASVERGLTPYVGRDDQLSLLRAYFAQARRGEGQVVLVSGEAGVGKSRLLLEFRRSIEREATWLEGRCISWGDNFPFLPIVDIARQAFMLEEGDDDETIAARIDERVAGWGAAREVTPYLKYLLGADPGDSSIETMDPIERRSHILEALRTLLRRAARPDLPAVVVVEDLHWVDEQSQEALSVLIDAVPSAPVLLIVTHRPGFMHGLGDRTYYSYMTLRNLPPEHSEAMVEGLLQAPGIPAELQRLIVSKAEGNPFYIEEVSRSLVETGVLRRENGVYELARSVSEIRIPDTVQEVILSRLDRLERPAREAVQHAAVIGREFPVRLLAHVSAAESGLDVLLDELKSLELIYEKSYFPELAYMFKHALTQEVALSTLLADRRKALHRTVAMAIEELYADRLQEHHESLAYHYYEGEEWEKAAEFGTQVALRAAALYAPRAVIDHATRAIDSAMRCVPEQVDPELYRLRASAHDAVGDFERSRVDHECAIAAARERGDAHAEWRATAELGMLWAGRDYARTGVFFERAHEIARNIADDRLIASSLNRLGNWCINTERPVEGLQHHETARSIFTRLEDKAGLAETLDFLAMAYAIAGDMPQSQETGLLAVELYRELEDRKGLAGVLPIIGWCGTSDQFNTLVPFGSSDEDSGVLLEEGLQIAGSIGWRAGEAYALMQRVIQVIPLGEYRQAMTDLREGLAIAEEIEHKQWRTGLTQLHASLNLDVYNLADALPAAEQALALSYEIGSEHWRGAVLATIVPILLELGDVARAEEVLDPAVPPTLPAITISQRSKWAARVEILLAREEWIAAVQTIDMLGMTAKHAGPHGTRAVPWLAWKRAMANIGLGRIDAADGDLAAAIAIARKFRSRPLLWRMLATCGELERLQGQHAAAAETFRESLRIIEELATQLDEPKIRGAFLDAPRVRAVRDGATTAGSL
jgi:class 3 adenylate cyclase/tetratricopeptide (TPR) repeat protein